MGMPLEKLETMARADKLYLKSMQKNIDIIGERMGSMKLGDRPVKITDYPTKEEEALLHRVLREYEPLYDETIRDKSKQKKMTRINQILCCPKHCKFSKYVIEFMLCGEVGCRLCPRMPRVVQIGDDELTKEVMTFCPLPCIDADGKTFLPIDECQLRLEKGDTLATELADLERVRKDVDSHDTELQAKHGRDKKLVTGINASKVRKVLKCSDCGAPRCVFSRYAINNPNGPSRKDMAALEKHVEENGYKCGDLVRVYANGKMELPDQEEGKSETGDVAEEEAC